MQIQLKQTEIVAALKQYVQAQGINLVGKNVDITFTAGRKEAGIVADISIEDSAQVLGLAPTATLEGVAIAKVVAKAHTPVPESVGTIATPAAMVTEEVQESKPEKAAASLFN